MRLDSPAAKIIASLISGMDPDKAYILGLLHDIGRHDGRKGVRHCYDGYKFLQSLGYNSIAKISLTHGFPTHEVLIIGENDLSNDEIMEINGYLKTICYDDYDRLIHVCDLISYPIGFVLLEKRLINIGLRKGFDEKLEILCKSAMSCKTYFESKIGYSIYHELPNVIDNTFENSDCKNSSSNSK